MSNTENIEVERRFIRQIIPAHPGTRSVWRESLDSSYVWLLPVLVWARFRTKIEVKNTGDWKVKNSWWSPYEDGTSVGGMVQTDAGLSLCEDDKQFVGYLAPGEELTAEWWGNAGWEPPKAEETEKPAL